MFICEFDVTLSSSTVLMMLFSMLVMMLSSLSSAADEGERGTGSVSGEWAGE